MPTFASFDGLTLHYEDEGDGPVLVLMHGFAADTNVNYVRAGLLDALLDAGYRVIAYDARGHGLSEKPTDAGAYHDDAMRKDVSALLDHFGIEACTLVGYSMGGHTALRAAPDDARVQALVLLGVGDSVRGSDDPAVRQAMVDALLSDDPAAITAAGLGRFRIMAGMDHAPLVALITGTVHDAPDRIDEIDVPVLLVLGEDDDEAGDPTVLAGRLDAQVVRVPGDHFQANARPELHRAVLDFLATCPAPTSPRAK